MTFHQLVHRDPYNWPIAIPLLPGGIIYPPYSAKIQGFGHFSSRLYRQVLCSVPCASGGFLALNITQPGTPLGH